MYFWHCELFKVLSDRKKDSLYALTIQKLFCTSLQIHWHNKYIGTTASWSLHHCFATDTSATCSLGRMGVHCISITSESTATQQANLLPYLVLLPSECIHDHCGDQVLAVYNRIANTFPASRYRKETI